MYGENPPDDAKGVSGFGICESPLMYGDPPPPQLVGL